MSHGVLQHSPLRDRPDESSTIEPQTPSKSLSKHPKIDREPQEQEQQEHEDKQDNLEEEDPIKRSTSPASSSYTYSPFGTSGDQNPRDYQTWLNPNNQRDGAHSRKNSTTRTSNHLRNSSFNSGHNKRDSGNFSSFGHNYLSSNHNQNQNSHKEPTKEPLVLAPNQKELLNPYQKEDSSSNSNTQSSSQKDSDDNSNSTSPIPIIIQTDMDIPRSTSATSLHAINLKHFMDDRSDSTRGTPVHTPRPGISREPSGTNINSLFMRKLEGVPKTSPGRGALSYQSQQRGPKVDDATGTRSYIVNTREVDKKRLVDQFYNSINESHASSIDLASFKRGTVSPPGSSTPSVIHSPTAEKVFRFVEQKKDDTDSVSAVKLERKLNDEQFGEIVRNGGYTFDSSSVKVLSDEGLTNYLLNVDSITEEMTKTDPDGPPPTLEALAQITKRIADGVHQVSVAVDGGTDQIAGDGPLASLGELRVLSSYLTKLQDKTKELTDQLVENRESLRTGYKTDLSDSVNRLHQLLGEITVLETRLNQIRSRITLNKAEMSQEMLEKLEILELIENRFTEHSRVTRNRRFKQLNITLTVLVVLASIYFGFM